jgi:hypothetical protein
MRPCSGESSRTSHYTGGRRRSVVDDFDERKLMRLLPVESPIGISTASDELVVCVLQLLRLTGVRESK